MWERFRAILLTQYIGAIVTALVIMHGIQAAFSIVSLPLWFYVTGERSSRSVLETAEPSRWLAHMLPAVVQLALSAAVTYGLIRWLYGSSQDEQPVAET